MKNNLLKALTLGTLLWSSTGVMAMEEDKAAQAAKAAEAAKIAKADADAKAAEAAKAAEVAKAAEAKAAEAQKNVQRPTPPPKPAHLKQQIQPPAKTTATAEQGTQPSQPKPLPQQGLGIKFKQKLGLQGKSLASDIATGAKGEIKGYTSGIEAGIKEVTTAAKDELKENIDWAKKNPIKAALKSGNFGAAAVQVIKNRGIVGGGVAVLSSALMALLGIGGSIGGEIGIKEFLSGKQSDDSNKSSKSDTDPQLENPVYTPNPYPESSVNNDSYQKNLYLIASAYNKINESFEAALENGSNSSTKFRIYLGQVMLDLPTNVAIEYNFQEAGVGSVGTPLNQIEISIIPNEIGGYAITREDILAQVQTEYQEMASALLKPSAALIFTIKTILLCKSVFRDSTYHDNSERIREILTQSAILASRLALVEGYSSPSSLEIISELPYSLQEYLGKTITKIPTDMIKAMQPPLQSTSEDTSSDMQDSSLTTAFGVYCLYFQELQNKKFKGDDGYEPSDATLSKNKTIDEIIAILLRGVKDVVSAEMYLLATIDNAVELRKKGETFLINPSNEFNKIMKQPSELVASTLKKLEKSANDLKSDPQNKVYKNAYNTAKRSFDIAVKSMNNASQKYRNYYPPYLPISVSDVSSRTTVEFVSDALKNVRKFGHPEALSTFNKIYSKFQKPLGISISEVWEIAPLE